MVEFHAPIWIQLLGASILILLAAAWGIARRRSQLRAFGIPLDRARVWIRAAGRRRWMRAGLLAAAIALFAVAATQPRANPEKRRIRTEARDLAVLLDVSRSMLAEDLAPNRLDRAKIELARLADALEGDRIGLVCFAGDAVLTCPLTSNYTYFKDVVRNVTDRTASQGGTKIGDAIRKALSDVLGVDRGEPAPEKGVRPGETVLEEEARRKKAFADILLITDGEDHDSYPDYAAQRAADLGVGIYAVGIGSSEGSPIPILGPEGKEAPLRYKGEVVLSRLNGKALIDMVDKAPRGAYLPVGTRNFDLVEFYKNAIASGEGREVYEEQVFWTEVFQPFLLAGLALLVAALLVRERPAAGALAAEEATS